MGRIYRVYHSEQKPRAAPKLSGLTTAELPPLLAHPNGHVRDQAQELLVARAARETVPALAAMLREDDSPRARLHALATLEGLGKVDHGLIAHALRDEHPAVRIRAVQLAEGPGAADPSLRAAVAALASDPDHKVRIQLAFTLGEWSDPESGKALAQIAVDGLADSFLRAAIESSSLPHRAALTEAAARNPGQRFLLPQFLLSTAPDDREVRTKILDPLVREVCDAGAATPVALRLLVSWLDATGASPDWFASAAAGAREILDDNAVPSEARCAAAALLGRFDGPDPHGSSLLRAALASGKDPALQEEVCTALLRGRRPGAISILLDNWMALSHSRRLRILDVSAGRPEWASTVLEAVRAGRLPSTELDPSTRQRLRKHDNPTIQAVAVELFPLTPTGPEVVHDTLESLNALQGSAERGKLIHLGRCAVCHRSGGEGGTAGPDLDSLTDRSSEALLTSILLPNEVLEPAYLAYDIRLKNGDTLYGRITGESSGSLRLTGLDGTEQSVPRDSIEAVESRGVSLMPDGLNAGLSAQDLADLLAFLQEPR
jgi:putative heme-binding domain-containing protein